MTAVSDKRRHACFWLAASSINFGMFFVWSVVDFARGSIGWFCFDLALLALAVLVMRIEWRDATAADIGLEE